jgi:hypothetical protein
LEPSPSKANDANKGLNMSPLGIRKKPFHP